MIYKKYKFSLQEIEEFQEEFLRELLILSKTPIHNNINRVFGFNLGLKKQNSQIIAKIYQEYSSLGDLQKNHSKITENLTKEQKEKTLTSICLDISKGIEAIHKFNIIHLDLKP